MWIRVVVVGVLLTCAPVAGADTVDGQYLGVLSAHGVTGAPDQLIADGRAACDAYGTAGVVGEVFGLEGQGLSSGQAADLIMAGVRAYCPEKAPPM